MKLKATIFIFYLLFTSISYSDNHNMELFNKANYLKKPTGQYGVGFRDFHWVNQKACPDLNFNGKNHDDFSQGNTKYCHEIMARIYYPTALQRQPSSLYYRPFIESASRDMNRIPSIKKEQLEQLNKIRTFSRERSPVIRNKKFPILLFSPGFGCPVEMYENYITELVSQGYIIVGINTPFINLVALPNGHVVMPTGLSNEESIRDKFVPLQSQDLMYVYDKLNKLQHVEKLFSSMDIKHIGLLGHSIGAWTLLDVAYAHQSWFQAIVALDIGDDSTGQPLNKLSNFSIPVMYQINSIRKLSSPYMPITYQLKRRGYLVGISPNEQNDTYSHHMNFTDWSTLQYLPAYTIFFDHLKAEQMARGFDFKVMSHPPTKKDIQAFDKITYVISKQESTWLFSVYFVDIKNKNLPIPISYLDIKRVDGLSEALSTISDKQIEKLRESDIAPIKKIVISLNNKLVSILGTGDGWEITDSINIYLVNFFNMYLKHEKNQSFKKCIPLHKNTYIKCGPEDV